MLTRPDRLRIRILCLAAAASLAAVSCTTPADPSPLAGVRIEPDDPVIVVRLNQSVSLSAVCINARGESVPQHEVAWFTSNPLIAMVDNDGDVVGVAVGQATVSATCQGLSSTVQIQVTLVPVTSVTITPSPLGLFVGDLQQLALTALDSANNTLSLQGRQIIWSSDNLPVATVSLGGVVLGVSQGSANVRVTVDGVVSPPIVVTVQNIPVASVTILPLNPPSLKVGLQFQLAALLRDSKGNQLGNRPIAWTSSAEGVATVGATTGLVTAVSPGTTTIQATVEGVIGSTVLTIIP